MEQLVTVLPLLAIIIALVLITIILRTLVEQPTEKIDAIGRVAAAIAQILQSIR